MKEEIREILREKSEADYRDFSASLVPGSKPLLGVRLPVLRKLAKEMVKGDWRALISSYDGEYEDQYFEETMLRALIIGYGTEKGELREGLAYVERLIPYIDNWSVCDSFCNSFLLAGRYRKEVWGFLQKYLYSDQEFEVRVAVITLLNQYLKYDGNGKKISRIRSVAMEDLRQKNAFREESEYPYLARILEVLNREYTQGYYAQMAAAWTAAEAFVTFPYDTMQMLSESCRMDDWTYHKTLQKICESRVPDAKVKQYIRSCRRKAEKSGA